MKWSEPESWHYAANVFPLMEPDELEALAADIKSNGLLNPIIRCGGKILDGRNRANACVAAGVELRFRDISEKEAVSWARSQNIFRRTLKPEQQAFALIALSQNNDSTPKGRKRLKAYHKLKKLKEGLWPLIEKAKGGSDVSADLIELLKPKKKEAEKSIFESLSNRLRLFRPTWSDGDEHTFVRHVEKATTITATNDVEKYHREVLILNLEKLSQDFLMYSERLKAKAAKEQVRA